MGITSFPPENGLGGATLLFYRRSNNRRVLDGGLP